MTLFVSDSNLGLPTQEQPWTDLFAKNGIEVVSTNDLERIDAMLAECTPDIAFIPVADFHRVLGTGDRTYRGLVAATSKVTGQSRLRSLLVVRHDDPAKGLDDLQGAKFGYINKSCSSSYFPPAILLNRQGKALDEFLEMTPVEPGATWQGLVDAVVSGEVRATMILEDTWTANPGNARTTKVIGDYAGGLAGVVVVRHDLDGTTRETLLDALLAWMPTWDDKVYGAFKPFYQADVHAFFHDLDQLPAGL